MATPPNHDDAEIDRLKAEIARALAAGDEAAVAEAHRDMIDLEHLRRVAETVRRYGRKIDG